jgi:hypothetical protein
MLTLTAAAAAITGYLAKSLKENKSIAAFFNDFTDSSVAWIRPVFIKEDGTPKKVVNDLLDNPDDKTRQAEVQKRIEIAAEDDDNALPLLREMAAKIATMTGNTTITQGDNSKNTMGDDNSVNNSHNTTINYGTGNQINTGSGNNIGRDSITHNTYYGSCPIDPASGGVWKTMLSHGKIKDAIEYLLAEYATDADKTNTLYSLLGQYNFNETNLLKGIVTDSVSTANRNKIVNSLLELFGKD